MAARPDPRDLQRSLRRVDGWFTLGLVILVCATLAWSLDDALLVLGRDELTDFLFWAAIGGVAAGFIGATVDWGRWTTHVVGAVFAALVVPLLVGAAMDTTGAPLGALFQITTDEVVQAWSDLVLAGRFSTVAYGHHLLVLGLLVWASSQFASYAAFGHRRPMYAIAVIGLLLVANMALTVRDQLTFLVIFSIASLFLLVRFHTLEEQSDWLRRRIGDPASISALYLRGGTVFIIAAISGSLLLTTAAASAPLAGAWSDVGARLIEWGQVIERFLPPSRTGRSLGPSFGSTARVTTAWLTSDEIAMRVDYAPGETESHYLLAQVYDEFELGGWSGEGTPEPRDPSAELLAGTGDAVGPDGFRVVTATITPSFPRRDVFVPGMPAAIGQPVSVSLIGPGRFFAEIERETSDAPYTISALVPAAEKDGGRTAEQLRAAGTDYPADILATYGRDTLPAGALGPLAREYLQGIVADGGPTNPYDMAIRIRDTLLDGREFRYDTDVSDLRCDDPSIVECFVQRRAGFCQFYASTMAVFMRELGYPARFVQGFLPGEPDPGGSDRTIRTHDAHAWVQVYFPGYGWVDFDPTGGGVGNQLAPIPSGQPVASATPRPSSSGGGAIPSRPIVRDDESDGPGGSVSGGPRSGPVGPLIAVAILLGVIVAAVAAVAWQRGPRGPETADGAYGSVARLATRLGFGPRPEQTVYEYAGALSDALPNVRPELETVARAKVEVAYGGRVLTDDRLAGLRHAHRRLRVNLLRLAFRRGRRRR